MYMREPQKAKAVTSPTSARLPAATKMRKVEMKVGKKSFEFCEVCNLNHDQGRRHKYFPAHGRALVNMLSRYQNKLSEVRFFIQNPNLLRPEHAAHNRIWCVFCAVDINEIGGYFVCGNAIRHMAGEEHSRNLKRFLWKHGKGIDQYDLFIVTEEDLLKWEKNCEVMKNAASCSSEGPIGPVLGPSKELRIMYDHRTDFKEKNIVLQMPTLITSSSEGSQRNVHTGGLPPWLDMCDEHEKNLVNFGAQTNNTASPVQKRKSKLNPKRVGAAWAEKRKIELEMEEKGEIFDIVDANWLPNFGRVWQAGTRKESRKEFEIENRQLFKDDMHVEASFKLQPYISKQMRMGSSSKVTTVDPFIEQQ